MSSEEWIRPASGVELGFSVANANGCLIGCYCMEVEARKPLKEEDVLRSLNHLKEVMPTLQICFKERDETLWVKSLPSYPIDFKIVEDSDLHEVLKYMNHTPFNSEFGPLWRVRVIPQNKSVQKETESRNEPLTYSILLAFHHSISDATTTLSLINKFISLLNDIILKKDITCGDGHVGQYLSNNLIDPTINATREKMLDRLDDEINAYKTLEIHQNIYGKYYRGTELEENVTKHILYKLNEEETNLFITKCKSAEVSVHAAFLAILDAAFVDLVQNSGAKDEQYIVANMDSVGMRRYYSGDVNKIFGNHTFIYFNQHTVPADVKNDIWSYARSIYLDLHTKIKSGIVVEQEVVRREMFARGQSIALDYKTCIEPNTCYTVSNIGKIDYLMQYEGTEVTATSIYRCISIHKIPSVCNHNLQTFRNQLFYSLDYSVRFMCPKTANELVQNLFSILRESLHK